MVGREFISGLAEPLMMEFLGIRVLPVELDVESSSLCMIRDSFYPGHKRSSTSRKNHSAMWYLNSWNIQMKKMDSFRQWMTVESNNYKTLYKVIFWCPVRCSKKKSVTLEVYVESKWNIHLNLLLMDKSPASTYGKIFPSDQCMHTD